MPITKQMAPNTRDQKKGTRLLAGKTGFCKLVDLRSNHRQRNNQSTQHCNIEVDHQQLLRSQVDEVVAVPCTHVGEYCDDLAGKRKTDQKASNKSNGTDDDPLPKLSEVAAKGHCAIFGR